MSLLAYFARPNLIFQLTCIFAAVIDSSVICPGQLSNPKIRAPSNASVEFMRQVLNEMPLEARSASLTCIERARAIILLRAPMRALSLTSPCVQRDWYVSLSNGIEMWVEQVRFRNLAFIGGKTLTSTVLVESRIHKVYSISSTQSSM